MFLVNRLLGRMKFLGFYVWETLGMKAEQNCLYWLMLVNAHANDILEIAMLKVGICWDIPYFVIN